MPTIRYLRINSLLPAILLQCLFFLSPLFSIAQMKTISGFVTDESGSPLPAITVKVQKTGTTAMTNEKGGFAINADTGDTLVFSSINTEIATVVVGSQLEYNVVLKLKI